MSTNGPTKAAAMTPTAKSGGVGKADEAWTKPASREVLERLMPAVQRKLEQAVPRAMRDQTSRLARAVITECGKNPALLQATPLSLYAACIQAGSLGLTIGGPQGEAYLIPFKSDVTLVIGYKGFIQLAYRSGIVKRISPRVVRKGDVFDVEYGTSQRIVHKPRLENGMADATHYYAVVELRPDGEDFEVMSMEQMLEFKSQYALSKNGGPWNGSKNDFDGMALKTVIRRLAKRLPISVEFAMAARLDEQAERNEPQDLTGMYGHELMHGEPEPPKDPADELRGRLEAAKEEARGGRDLQAEIDAKEAREAAEAAEAVRSRSQKKQSTMTGEDLSAISR